MKLFVWYCIGPARNCFDVFAVADNLEAARKLAILRVEGMGIEERKEHVIVSDIIVLTPDIFQLPTALVHERE